MRTRDYLYIRNVRPNRWPAGDPQLYFAVGPFGDIDGGPSKTLLLGRPDDRLFALATAKRPAEELYDLRSDPWQIENVAARAWHAGEKTALAAMVREWMRTTGDPRATSDDDRWDKYPTSASLRRASLCGGPRRQAAGSGRTRRWRRRRGRRPTRTVSTDGSEPGVGSRDIIRRMKTVTISEPVRCNSERSSFSDTLLVDRYLWNLSSR